MDREDRAEVLAAACHTAWYTYTVLGLGEDGEPWEAAPEWQKDSMRDAIDFWDGMVFDLSEKEVITADLLRNILPELSHENWCKHKRDNGWVYGAIKDAKAKTHPCLIAYGDLPNNQRLKDLVVLEAYLALEEAGI